MKKFNLQVGMKQMVFATKTPIDDFYREEVTGSRTNETAVAFVNPLQVLLNQKRLDAVGAMGIEQWLSSFDLKSSSALDKLRSQCSDDDLLKTMKSRHLQSPAEILAWSRYMADHMDEFNAQVKATYDAEMAVQDTKVETDKTE